MKLGTYNWYQSLIEEILSIRSFIQQDSSRFCSCDSFLGKNLFVWFLGVFLKLNRNTHLVFDSDHFLAFILIFGVKIVPGFAFFEYFLRSFVVSGTFPIGSPNASRSLPDREPECYSAISWYLSRVLQCRISIGNPIPIGNPIEEKMLNSKRTPVHCAGSGTPD